MITVWKFKLLPGFNDVSMPTKATVLSAAIDPQGGIVVYAMVDTAEQLDTRYFDVVPTGGIIADMSIQLQHKFVGTVQLEG